MVLRITVEITAVEFRRLNSFEWAVLAMLNTFQGNPPSVAEAATHLSIGEPAFLIAALDTLYRVGAAKLRGDEVRPLDLKAFEITQTGLKFFCDEGWEEVNAQAFSETIPFEWPSLRICPYRREEHREKKLPAPPLDEIQAKLTVEALQAWLNSNTNAQCWHVKEFFVTNVESQ